MNNNWIEKNGIKVVAIALALGALAPVPYYAYYQLMDWVVVGAAVVSAWQAYKRGNTWMVWLFALVAAVFNPLAPFYFRSDIWHYADIAVAAIFAIALIIGRNKN